MHKTTITLRTEVWLRLRNRAEREGTSIGTLVNDLLAEALLAGEAGSRPVSIGAGKADVDDLGENARKYLRRSLR